MTNATICAEYSTQTTEQQPVGPCVLRPGHRGHIHQDMRGVQWPSRPDSSGCCVCGGGPIVYDNYLGNPVCAHCSDCTCGERPCAVDGQDQPAAGGIVRFSPDGDWCILPLFQHADKGLQARLTAALRAMHRSEQEIADLRAELRSRDEVIAQQRAAARHALRDVAAVARVRALADRWYGQGAPATSYARELLANLDTLDTAA